MDEECLDQEAVYFETDLQRVMENADALPDAPFCSADRGLAHVGPGTVNTQGSSSRFQYSLGSPCAAVAEGDSKSLVHYFEG